MPEYQVGIYNKHIRARVRNGDPVEENMESFDRFDEKMAGLLRKKPEGEAEAKAPRDKKKAGNDDETKNLVYQNPMEFKETKKFKSKWEEYRLGDWRRPALCHLLVRLWS